MTPEIETVESWSVTVFVGGSVADAKRALSEECEREGLCVTLTPTTFVYTHGAEEGVAVGFVNYPRFPKPKKVITARAIAVATLLMEKLFQRTALVQTPTSTIWLRRPDAAPNPN